MTREVDVKALISHIVRGDGADKCRICMGDTSEGQVYLGDTVMMDGERPVTLAEIVEVITGVDVSEEAELPSGLCTTCSGSAIDAAHFAILCRQANSYWNTTLHHLNDLPLPKKLPAFSKAIYVKLDNDHLTVIHDYKVTSIEEKFKDLLKNYRKRKRIRKKSQSLHYKCPNCDKSFKNACELSHHLKWSSDDQRACYVCAKIMSREDLINHLSLTHKILPFDCKTCPALFNSKIKYMKHLKEAHTSGVCTCGDCGRTFQSQFGYHAHQPVHLPKTCPACDKLFRNRRCYIYHLKVCCKLDKMRSGRRETKKITIEVKNKLSTKKIRVGLRGSAQTECICDYCGKKLSSKKFIRAHIQHVHLKTTHRPCPYCGKSLASAHMTEHIKTHELVRKFKCEHCHLVLKTRLGFIQHLRLHSGEKPFACNQCGETFSASSRRSQHIRKVHGGGIQLKHACKLCPARFPLPFRLRKHMAAVHNDNSNKTVFECNDCHEKFSSCRGLIHHARKHQKDTIQPTNTKLIDEDKFCPRGACVTCASTAMAAQEFRLFVRNSQNIWHKTISTLNKVPNSDGPSVKSLCTFVKPENLQMHTVKDYIGGDSKTTLNKLKHRFTRKKTEIEKKTRTSRMGPKCKCPDCGKSFFSPYFLNVHLKNSGFKEACIQCGTITSRGSEMKDHLSRVHGEELILCRSCPTLFEDELRLEKHVKKAHKAGAWTCGDCGRSFPGKASFEVHSQMHAVRMCRSCGAQFTNRGCYREHRAKCEPDARPANRHSLPRNKRSNIRDPAVFTCDYCGKSYLSRPQLKNHIIWIHMDVRPHQCQWCGKRFYTPSRLAEHSIVHTRERNFECDICGAKLVSKMAAIYHRRRHTGEKPYECEDCGERFISSSRRSEHAKRRHGKGPKIICMQCPSSFVRSHELRKHMEKMHRTSSTQT